MGRLNHLVFLEIGMPNIFDCRNNVFKNLCIAVQRYLSVWVTICYCRRRGGGRKKEQKRLKVPFVCFYFYTDLLNYRKNYISLKILRLNHNIVSIQRHISSSKMYGCCYMFQFQLQGLEELHRHLFSIQQRMFLSRDEDAVNRPRKEHSCGEIVFIWYHPIAGNDIYS